jgi:hypothetical protein
VHRAHTLAYVLVIALTASAASFADGILTIPVGPVEFLPLHDTPSGMFTSRLREDGGTDIVITFRSPSVSLVRDKDITNVELPFIPRFAVSLLTSKDRHVLACVPSDEERIEILEYHDSTNTFRQRWSIELQAAPYLLQTADITGDKNEDLLLLVENRPGIGVLRSRGDGSFREPEFIFDDIIVSQFQVVDLNGDGINDVVLYDPIKNMLRIHYGFGRMTFSLEKLQPLSASVNYFRAIPVIDESVFDLVVVYPDAHQFRVLIGDGFGRYAHLQTRSLTSASNAFLFCDLFDSQRMDLAVLEYDTGILRFFRNSSRRGFEASGAVVLGTGVRELVFIENGDNDDASLYVLDGGKDRLIVLDRLPAVRDFLPDHLAVGGTFADVVTANLFGGRLPELYVLSNEPSAISVYWYDERFRLNHSMIPVPGSPDRLFVQRGPMNRSKLVVSDRTSDLITVVSIRWDRGDVNIYGIPAMAGSDIIYLGLTSDNRFQFGTIAYRELRSAASISVFEQIGSDEYIEHTITPIQHEHVLGLDVLDITGNSIIDIVYLYQAADTTGVFVTAALNDAEYGFRRSGNVLVLGDVPVTGGFLLAEHTGEIQTFIVYLESENDTQGRFVRLRGNRHGTLSVIDKNSGGRVVRSSRDIVFLEALPGSFHDMVYYNRNTRAIELTRSEPDGVFAGTKQVYRVEDCVAFTVFSEPLGEVHMLVIGKNQSPFLEAVIVHD